TYTVSVTATDKDHGMSTPATLVLIIASALTAGTGGDQSANEGTNVTITGPASGGFAPYAYHWAFGDGSTADGTLTPSHTYAYNWNFGDGTTGSGASLSHTFTTAGTYTVSVNATDKDGGTSPAATRVVTVSSPAAGVSYYIAPNTGSGTGTIGNPYGLADLQV